jgi:hypothetical protein
MERWMEDVRKIQMVTCPYFVIGLRNPYYVYKTYQIEGDWLIKRKREWLEERECMGYIEWKDEMRIEDIYERMEEYMRGNDGRWREEREEEIEMEGKCGCCKIC